MGKYWVTVNGKPKRTAAGVKHEYEKFQSSRKAKKDRAARNRARRYAAKKGLVHKGDNKDVDHIKGLSEGGSRSLSNTRVISRSKNRGRRQASRRKGSKRNKRRWGL